MNQRIREYAPKNYLNSSLYQSFSLLGLLQVMLGWCRVDTRNRYVTRPSVYQKAYSVLLAAIIGIMYASIHIDYMDEYKANRNIYRLGTGFIVSHFLVFSINLFHIRFCNNDRNINFVMSMQQIDRCMKINRDKRFSAILRKINNISALLMIGAFFVLVMCSLYEATIRGVVATVTGALGEGILISDLTLCSNLMVFFTMRIRFVNAIIANHLKQHDAFELHEQFFNKNSFINKWAEKSHDFTSCDTYKYLKEIMEGFYDLQNIFQLQVIILSEIIV